jgi:hypothetical protein
MATDYTHAVVGLGLARVYATRTMPWAYWGLAALLPIIPALGILNLARVISHDPLELGLRHLVGSQVKWPCDVYLVNGLIAIDGQAVSCSCCGSLQGVVQINVPGLDGFQSVDQGTGVEAGQVGHRPVEQLQS